jgi:hypothetical protein
MTGVQSMEVGIQVPEFQETAASATRPFSAPILVYSGPIWSPPMRP